MGCRELLDALTTAILDEQKAQNEYSGLAENVRKFICDAKCPTGKVSESMIDSIAIDEAKHEKMLTNLLTLIRERCPNSEFPVTEDEAAIGLGKLFG